jgi:hypothetical protein
MHLCAEIYKIAVGEGRILKGGVVPTYITVVSKADCVSPCQRLRRVGQDNTKIDLSRTGSENGVNSTGNGELSYV